MSNLLLITAIGCGLIGGAFFVFSVMVMPALEDLPADQGIAAMQSINRVAVTPWFMTAFFAPAILCLVLAVRSVVRWDDAGSLLTLIGSGGYLIGSIALTIAFHVPRNDTLAKLDPGDSKSATYWETYLSQWTMGNHVRAAASLAAAVLLTLALAAVRADDDGEASTTWPQPDPYGRVMISSR